MMQDEASPELDLDGAIWRFALDFYGAPGSADACLRLQDGSGLDVVSLIVVLYADAKLKRRLSADEIAMLQGDTRHWRAQTVLPLRALRRRLKSPAPGFPPAETEALRGLIKTAELRAEQIQLAMGERWLVRHPAQDGLAVERALALLAENAPDARPADFSQLIGRVIGAARAAADQR